MQPIPLAGALFAWLRANLPSRSTPAVTLWGDPGPHNVLHTDGVITGMLDWELAHAGDPLEDLGAAAWATGSIADPELVIVAYEATAASEVDRTALRWFRVFAAVTRAVMLITGTRNVVAGEARSPSLAGLTLHLLPRLLQEAAATAGWPEPEEPQPVAVESQAAAMLRPDTIEVIRTVAEYLATDALAATRDRLTRRNLKTAAALLAATESRLRFDGTAAASNDAATRALLADIGSKGVPLEAEPGSLSVALEEAARSRSSRTQRTRTCVLRCELTFGTFFAQPRRVCSR